MTRLNGWIRLWIVASVFWIAIGCYLAYDPVTLLYTKKTFDATKDGLGTAVFVFSAAQSDAQDYVGRTLIPLVEKDPKSYVNKIDYSPYRQYIAERAPALIGRYVVFALVPVFAALVFGWAVAWVRRGFGR